jgi:hypothetical protein
MSLKYMPSEVHSGIGQRRLSLKAEEGHFHWICGSRSSDYEEYYLLKYVAM